MREHFDMMAAYNAWANEKLYAAALALPDPALREDRGAFFKSLHGTLNHLYVADTIWMSRFRGLPNPPWTLDHTAHDSATDLHRRRVTLDRDIIGFVGGLTDAMLGESFSYVTVNNPARITQTLGPALAHFFNHQTHHRGQCHVLLTRQGVEAPAMDLLYFQRGM